MKYLGLIVLACIAVVIAAPAEAQVKLGDFNDWSAYQDGTAKNKACYMVSKPKTKAGSINQRGDTYVLLTNWQAEKTRNVFELHSGYPYKDGSAVDVVIDGGKPIALFTKESTAWAADALTDQAIADAMRKGHSMVVVGTSNKNNKTTDTYSLSGFGAANDRIAKECGSK